MTPPEKEEKNTNHWIEKNMIKAQINNDSVKTLCFCTKYGLHLMSVRNMICTKKLRVPTNNAIMIMVC